LLGNQVVVTVCLLDMLFWGYVWTVVRDESRAVLKGLQERKSFEHEDDDEEEE